MTLTDRLRIEGYETVSARDGETGFRLAREGNYDIILMDIGLPGKDGLTVCRDLRAAGSRTPILVLTARGQVMDRVLGLKMGADDYLPKPFEMIELIARMEALVRRTDTHGPAESAPDVISFGDFELYTQRQELQRGDEVVPLSTQEFRLLQYLVQHPGRVFDRDELLDAVWGYDSIPTTRTVDVHIAWIRQKIGDSPHPRHIITVRKRGYKFVQ